MKKKSYNQNFCAFLRKSFFFFFYSACRVKIDFFNCKIKEFKFIVIMKKKKEKSFETSCTRY